MRLAHRVVQTFARLSLLALTATAVGCSDAAPARAHTDESAVTEESLTLSDVLPELADLGITDVVVRKVVDPRFRELREEFAENRYYLKIEFSSLTAAQFKKLKKLFGGHSEVAFEEGRAYELTDFLHPAMQALANHTLAPMVWSGGSDLRSIIVDEFPSDGSEESAKKRNLAASIARNEFSHLTNCYNTSAEIVRMMHPDRQGTMEMFLYFPDRFQADHWFGAKAPQADGNIPKTNEFSSRVDESKLAFGDVLVVRSKTAAYQGYPLLAHTAIAISQKLVFEKTDSSKDDPYRISLRKDVTTMYERKLGADFVVDYRRFNGDGKKPIPAPTLPTGELPDDGPGGPMHRLLAQIKADYPTLDLDRVTLSTDAAFGAGGSATLPSEIRRAKVVIGSDGRGVLEADETVLSRFEALEDGR